MGPFLICESFPVKMGVLLLLKVDKLQPRNTNNLCPCDVRKAIAVLNYWPGKLYPQVFTLKLMMSSSGEEYITRFMGGMPFFNFHNFDFTVPLSMKLFLVKRRN